MTNTLRLDYHPPYDWRSMLSYLRTRGSAGVELVEENRYHRTVTIDKCAGWLSVTIDSPRNALIATLSPALLTKKAEISARLKTLFDLDARPQIIEKVLGDLARAHPGLRIPGAFEPFEIAVRAILGQQISVKAATSLACRVAARFGGEIETPYEGLNLLAPSADSLAAAREAELTELGIMPSRARWIIGFARAYSAGEIDLSPDADYNETVQKLIALPGFGEWTAEYIAMRCLSYRDAFMHGDLGIKKALGESKKKAILEIVEKYRPWRAYAAMHLWKSLEKTPL